MNAKGDFRDAKGDFRDMPATKLARSAYVHIPFCRHRCGYCNFSLVAGRDYLIERYLDALAIEIRWLGEPGEPDTLQELDTLFLGGGTPSHLSPGQLERLGKIINSQFRLAADAEVTAECNPNDLDRTRAEALRAIGVNRISLGVQSFRPDKLRQLERDHSPAEVSVAIDAARACDMQVSIDLIFAAANETAEQWDADLTAAFAHQPDHLSTYELTYEKGTQFWNRLMRGELLESDEDLRADMYLATIERCGQLGWEHYEVSSFAKPDRQCRHNLTYWTGLPYLAFGSGASRFVDGIRETNHQSVMSYLKSIEAGEPPVAQQERLAPLAAALEQLAIGLRLRRGIEPAEFALRTGFEIPWILDQLGRTGKQLLEFGLLLSPASDSMSGNDDGYQANWRLSERGLLLCDWIATELLSVDS